MAEADFSNLHGVIIGIDEYDGELSPLEGCANDANRVFEYLTTKLGVPQDQLVRLTNEQATKQNIIDTFRNHLILNKNIRHSDPILYYFAGHGQQLRAPPEWHHADDMTESHLPYTNTRCRGSGCLYAGFDYGITDRHFGALLHELYESKGDNITIILDSCHSGSGTRGGCHTLFSAVKQPMTNKDECGKFTTLSQAPSLDTYVLLAACQSTERALEIPGTPSRGLFTDSLLEALQTLDLTATSYFALMRKVREIAHQSLQYIQSGGTPIICPIPQCEGRKQDRLLFRTQFAHPKGIIPLIRGKSNMFAIPAGSTSGIQQGTELAVRYGNMSKKSEPLGRLIAIRVEAMASVLIPMEGNPAVAWPEYAYVVVTKYTGYTFRIFVDNRIEWDLRWQEILSQIQTWPINIVWSEPGEPSNLILRPVQDGIEIERWDPSILQLAPPPIILSDALSEAGWEDILPQMAHFHFHLQRRNPGSPLAGLVEMKLIELKHKVDRFEYEPVNPARNLFGNSLYDGTVVELKADSWKRYGLQLINRSNSPLYAWVIYFDLGDYSIQFIYTPPSRTMSPPLAANGGVAFPVGYGDSGSKPLRIENSTGERETGVFMLCVTSKWVDIEHIEQDPILRAVAKPKKRDDEGTQSDCGLDRDSTVTLNWRLSKVPFLGALASKLRSSIVGGKVKSESEHETEQGSIRAAVDPKDRWDDLRETPLANNCWDVLTVGVSISSIVVNPTNSRTSSFVRTGLVR